MCDIVTNNWNLIVVFYYSLLCSIIWRIVLLDVRYQTAAGFEILRIDEDRMLKQVVHKIMTDEGAGSQKSCRHDWSADWLLDAAIIDNVWSFSLNYLILWTSCPTCPLFSRSLRLGQGHGHVPGIVGRAQVDDVLALVAGSFASSDDWWVSFDPGYGLDKEHLLHAIREDTHVDKNKKTKKK